MEEYVIIAFSIVRHSLRWTSNVGYIKSIVVASASHAVLVIDKAAINHGLEVSSNATVHWRAGPRDVLLLFRDFRPNVKFGFCLQFVHTDLIN